MRKTLQIVTPPAVEPVSPTLLLQHCRIDADTDTTLVTSFGVAARAMAEQYTARALITTGFTFTVAPDDGPSLWSRHRWPSVIELPRSPADAVSAVVLTDITGTQTTIASSDYLLDAAASPARLRLNYSDNVIPSTQPVESVQIAFTAGYGADGTHVPQPIISAILLITAFLYEHRGDEPAEIPRAAEWLLDPYRVAYFGG